MEKTALVVDDSRVALLGLARLLREQGLLVDTAESGPEAIDYLKHNPPPAAIFLDHMMPGMDGFETLTALKSSPATSAIPVVMYTSKEGEAYMHEAQARGAFGVLFKPPQPLEIQRILTALPESRRKSETTVTVGREVSPRAPALRVLNSPASAKLVMHPTASLPAEPVEEAVPESPRVSPWLGVALLVPLVIFGAWWFFAKYGDLEKGAERLMAENASLKREQARLLTENARLQTEHANAQDAVARSQASAEQQRVLFDTISWALSDHARYDFGEIPFSDARLELLRGLIARLTEANFRGVIRLDSHLGEFCLVRDNQGRQRVPAPGTPFSACERATYPPAEAVRLARRQSEAFTRFITDRTATRGPIEIAIFSHGTSRPLQRYPESAPSSAAEWNVIARRNQRVDITIVPAGTVP